MANAYSQQRYTPNTNNQRGRDSYRGGDRNYPSRQEELIDPKLLEFDFFDKEKPDKNILSINLVK